MRTATAVIGLVLLSCATFWAGAQPAKKTISGIVKNIQNEPIPGATVSLLVKEDGAVIIEAAADKNGRFQLMIEKAGVYLLSITAAGHESYTSPSLTLDATHNHINLPAIILQFVKGKNLKPVVITAKKSLVELDLDKTIINVEAMIGSASSNALEILGHTPGVVVNANGDISLNGKNGVLILIDGRQTYLAATDLAAYLRSLPGGLLDKLELMDNPPAKYEASGAAIINIRLKKKKAAGFTGSLSGGFNQGTYTRHNEAVNINYNRKKVNTVCQYRL